MGGFWHSLGRLVGRGLAAISIKAFRGFRDGVHKSDPEGPAGSGGCGSDDREVRVMRFKPSIFPNLPPGATIAAVLVVGLLSIGASCPPQVKDFGDGLVEGAIDCYQHPDQCAPKPAPAPDPGSDPSPRPTPTQAPVVTPTQAPVATPTPSPVSASGCHLPAGSGDGVDCPRLSSGAYVADVGAATRAVISAHPSWSVDGGANILPQYWGSYYAAIVANLKSAGFCAFLDGGNEIGLKRVNSFSEQYATLSSGGRVRLGVETYRATCTPAWSAIPAGGVISDPTPEPTPDQNLSLPPYLVKVRVGDHCQNPSNGPKYANHLCIVTSTGVYRPRLNPDDVSRDSPCDREPALSAFCNNESQDDPAGVIFTVIGAEDLGLDESNPQQVVVRFTPGQEFTVCARPRPDPSNSHGQPVEVLGSAEDCKRQTQF